MKHDKDALTALRREHTPEGVRTRLASKPPLARLYLRDAVLGGMDGCITTFAIVAGAAGANLPSIVIIILGFSNLVADGLSMALGNYLGVKSESEQLLAARRHEQEHINLIPEGEKEEIRQIFRSKGFEGEPLERIVETVASNHNWWIDIMIREEWNLSPVAIQPTHAALVTFFTFVTVGIAPLLPYILFPFAYSLTGFTASCATTALAFVAIGLGRAKMAQRPAWRCITETFLAGGVAAGAAYGIGHGLKALLV